MLFNTLTYWVFLIIVFAIYWLLNNNSKINFRNAFILATSYFFYGSWDERFLLLIIASSLVDFICGKKVFSSVNRNTKKAFLTISILMNLGMLGIFKYYNFFIDSFASFVSVFGFSPNMNTLSIILPVGISFYTFQTLSYTIDIYRGKLKPVDNPITFFTFVAFFPQLVAGPIERAANLLPQIQIKHQFDRRLAVSGLRFILWGLFKKVVIADRLSEVVDLIFKNPESYTGISLFIGAVFFGIQIYCDFSGYSDIAIGSARLLGIRLMDNFRTPYFSSSFREFWQRWHISLSTWFRDYLYIPMGGNRRGKVASFFILIATFVVSGLWHGANFTFIAWGFFHGLLVAIERLSKNSWLKIHVLIRGLFVFVMVNLLWIFFRANSIETSSLIFMKIFRFSNEGNSILMQLKSDYSETMISLIVGGILFVIIEVLIGKKDPNAFFSSLPRVVRILIYYFIILLILIFGVLDTAPQFIYFQF